ncbi:hypothetical protein CSB45_01375 [candidate division KSB3 bacterium]|uniref:Uncharacterized protein n=1 Tax=candidate division KSB3 bacterium TaxID=2044937 RepID=A0A2G6EAI7_9BACT|nr:MAG: hypothetical protein CSB45_01375 [candidate division KSB3 bacterium]PIE30753.1 MAG: hypothetical protein CSA57_01975 [candidate division KSB3 bacterium]
MNSDIMMELAKAIRTLYTLEDSIIHEDMPESKDLRSKQALLVSDVIQSLQELENTIRRESSFVVPKRVTV